MQEAGQSVFSPFTQDTTYFGRPEQGFVLNFLVDDLKGFLAELETKGVKTVKDFEEYEGIGVFAWIEDPRGNRIELWQAS
jgi:predicted enzyme related to lactoylglutathione lyase